jgi:hypothetical protein
VYETLEDGRINVEKMRRACMKALLADKSEQEPICLAVERKSSYQRLDH